MMLLDDTAEYTHFHTEEQIPAMTMRYDLYATNADNSARFVLGKRGKNPLFVVGANPSTADESRPDMTIAKVERFTRRRGYDGFVMLNLYPLRATHPHDLPLAADERLIRRNLRTVAAQLAAVSNPVVWAAWGNVIEVRPYLSDCLQRLAAVAERHCPKWIQCGALTARSHPRHPTRLGYKTRFRSFDLSHYLKNQRTGLK